MAAKDDAIAKPQLALAANQSPTSMPSPKTAERSKGIALLEGLLREQSVPTTRLPEGRARLLPLDESELPLESNWAWFKKYQLRHTILGISFLLLVALPSAMVSLYMAFFAADQYHSSASFSVRSIDAGGATDILGMFTQASSGSTVSDSYILMDYIMSERVVAAADQRFNLEKIYATRGLDYFYGIGSNLAVEDKLEYWKDMVAVNFDHASGIIQVTVKAFEPKQAQAITQFIVENSDNLVNGLSLAARNDVLRATQDEVLASEARLGRARVALRHYRDKSQEISPEEEAKLAVQLIASLEQQRTQLNADLVTARNQMDESTPRIRLLKTRIGSIEQQLSIERQRLGTGERRAGADALSAHDVAGRIAEFEELETEREFAERAYTASLASLEKARIEANNRQRYLAVFIEPTLSELAQYPTRFMSALLVTLGLLFAWGIGVMSYYNIRDRA
ncbi:RkpR, polysaccharide export protein [Ensifer adhaerens]|uniref:RkpR, polysaccharide export protein n=1 Tax=Ensifer adhaerens TaxID=106592 RepID=UPI00399B00B0